MIVTLPVPVLLLSLLSVTAWVESATTVRVLLCVDVRIGAVNVQRSVLVAPTASPVTVCVCALMPWGVKETTKVPASLSPLFLMTELTTTVLPAV